MSKQVITKKLQLNNVPIGLDSDQHLVIGSDKVVKKVADNSVKAVNGVLPVNGHVTVTVPAPKIQDVLIAGYATNQTIQFEEGLNFSNVGYNGISGQNSNNYGYYVSPGYIYASSLTSNNSVYITDTNLGFNKNGFGAIFTINPTAFRIISLPDQGGTLPMTVNGQSASNQGDVILSPVIATFLTNDGKTVTVVNGVITNVQ
ncbi:hypothetical protein [Flavobacterium tiangeerense]|uniref:hypothetical protein n=1 Tax=Flavobacterium tiangeerense TaxID=459471 RepID=UPI0011A29FE8|nr:hypothetical protein [Flavobacterium tiangeerense]